MLQISPKYSDQEAKLRMNLRYKYLQHDSSKWSYQAKNRGSVYFYLFSKPISCAKMAMERYYRQYVTNNRQMGSKYDQAW